MAVNPYFTFADPALQAQVVAEAQVLAAAEAARQQQRAATLAALRQERQLAADREERRAIREGDIRRLDASEAERRRQFDETLKFSREAETARTSSDAARRKEAEQREQYAAILRAIEGADGRSLPTAKELEARTADLLPQHRQLVMEARGRKHAELLNTFNLISAEVDRLNAQIGQDDPQKPGAKLTADALRRRSPAANNLWIGPDGRIQSLAFKPREDAQIPSASEGIFPQPSPGFVPRATDFPVTPMPGTGPSISEPIGAVQSRLSAGAGPMRQPGLLERYGRLLLDNNIHPVARLVNRFFVPPIGNEAAPSVRVPAPGPLEGVSPMGLAPRYAVPMDPMSDYLPSMPFVP